MRNTTAITILENIEYYLITHTCESCEQEHTAIALAIKALEATERTQGEWKVICDEDNIKTCVCSICGRIEDIVDIDKYPYCHCGAKMKGGVKNEK